MTQWKYARKRIGFVITLLLLLAAFASPTRTLAATECATILQGVTIQGNLAVPNGINCLLNGSTVTGNVTLGQGAGLISIGSTIQGKLSGDAVSTVGLDSGTVVKGSVTISGATSEIYIDSSRVNGNVALTGNAMSGALAVRDSTIGGNLTVSGNSSDYDSPFISNNAVGGNLTCEGNEDPPYGGGNAVSGRKTGQCAGL